VPVSDHSPLLCLLGVTERNVWDGYRQFLSEGNSRKKLKFQITITLKFIDNYESSNKCAFVNELAEKIMKK